jgi:hypothetical protein
MESNELDDRAAADAQLAALQAQRTALAERAMQPWWYDALLGVLLFGFIASYAWHHTWLTLGATAVFLLCLRGMIALYKRHTGFWISGFRQGRTQRAMAVWVACVLVVMGTGFAFDAAGVGWAMVAAGAVLGIAVAVVSRWWTRIYVAELREGL